MAVDSLQWAVKFINLKLSMESLPLLLILLAIIAFLYSSVGHGGVSGYLTVMALLGVALLMMKPSALIMNLAVSLFSFIRFQWVGFFKIKLFLPFALSSIPMTFLGGTLRYLLAVGLMIASVKLIVRNYGNSKCYFENRLQLF